MPNKLTKRNDLTKQRKQAKKMAFQPGDFDSALAGAGKVAGKVCLLLDISGSMSGRPIKKLRELVDGFPDLLRICFDSRVEVLSPGQSIPDARGGTNLAPGLRTVDREGYENAVFISDGMPHDPEEALLVVTELALHLDIIFVGEGEYPTFLEDLADACGGTFQTGDLEQTDLLADTVAGLLGEPEEERGPIVL